LEAELIRLIRFNIETTGIAPHEVASLNFQVQHPSFRVLSCRETTHTCRLRSAA
jgi:hypothetical protein